MRALRSKEFFGSAFPEKPNRRFSDWGTNRVGKAPVPTVEPVDE